MTTEQLALIESHREAAEKTARYMHLTYLPTLDRDDHVAVAYLSLCESALKYDPTSGVAFSTYLRRRIRWDLLDYFRKQFRTYTHDGESVMSWDEDWMADQFPVEGPDIPLQVTIRDALARLTQKQRTAIFLYYWRGRKLKEIAKALGDCSEKNVSQIISYGLRALHPQVKEQWGTTAPTPLGLPKVIDVSINQC